MCKSKDGKTKINIAESITSGADGTTSASGFCGLLLVLAGLILFLVLVGFYFFNTGEATNIKEFLDIDIIVISVGATLIGGRKIVGMLGNNRNSNVIKALSDVLDERDKKQQNERNPYSGRYSACNNETDLDA